MARRTLDRLLTFLGLSLTALLLIGGGLLTWGHYFVASAYPGALIMLILSALGWRHSQRLEHDVGPGAAQPQPSDQPAAAGKPVAAVGVRG